MSRMIPAAFLVAAFWSQLAAAQGVSFPSPPGQAPRDGVTARPGTAIIRGHVYDSANQQPLRKAQIRVVSPEIRESRLAITDANGAYEMRNLPAGRYQLTASKATFVELQYGQTRAFEQGKPLEIRDAQLVDKVDFSLPRGSVVTGRVVDELGELAFDVGVQIMRYQFNQGRRQLTPIRTAQTNDIGEFRLFGLPPGQYLVSTTFRAGIDLVDVPTDNRVGYPPTYYPGTTNVTEAQRITVGLSQTISEINLVLSPVRLARLAGTVVDSSGKPVSGGSIQLIQNTLMQTAGGQIRPDGSFLITNVAPGQYSLRARANTAGAAAEVIQADVAVVGEDITDLRLMGVRLSTATGRVIPADPQNTASLRELQLFFIPRVLGPQGDVSSGRVNDDGTFAVQVQPVITQLRLNPTGAFAGTRVKAVRLNGVDVTDSGIDFRPNENVSGLEVELTTQLGSVSGSVSDARGNPVKDYTVIIFPRDRERWEPTSRYLSSVRADQDGRYKAPYVLPGVYYAIALDYVEQGGNTDPELFERVIGRATQFSIGDTEAKRLDLKLVTAF